MAEVNSNPEIEKRGEEIVGILDATTQVDILDYFAAAALAGGLPEFFRSGDAWKDYDDFASSMFNVAEAMVRRRDLVRAQAQPELYTALLDALKTTAGNIRSLGPACALSKVPMEYEIWLQVVDAAIARAEGR